MVVGMGTAGWAGLSELLRRALLVRGEVGLEPAAVGSGPRSHPPAPSRFLPPEE